MTKRLRPKEEVFCLVGNMVSVYHFEDIEAHLTDELVALSTVYCNKEPVN